MSPARIPARVATNSGPLEPAHTQHREQTPMISADIARSATGSEVALLLVGALTLKSNVILNPLKPAGCGVTATALADAHTGLPALNACRQTVPVTPCSYLLVAMARASVWPGRLLTAHHICAMTFQPPARPSAWSTKTASAAITVTSIMTVLPPKMTVILASTMRNAPALTALTDIVVIPPVTTSANPVDSPDWKVPARCTTMAQTPQWSVRCARSVVVEMRVSWSWKVKMSKTTARKNPPPGAARMVPVTVQAHADNGFPARPVFRKAAPVA